MPSGAAGPGRTHRDLGRALLLRRERRSRPRRRHPRPLHVVRPLRGAARAAGHARPPARRRATGSSSTRTTTSTARVRYVPASRSTARTRLRSRAATAHGSCSARSSATAHSSRQAARCRLWLVHGSASTPARPARSTSRGRSTRPAASRTGPRHRHRFPSAIGPSSAPLCTAATSARTSARGTAASRSGGRDCSRRPSPSRSSRSLDWLEADGDELVARYDRLYVPRNDPRWLRRNALVAAGNVGGDLERDAVATYATGEDELLREHAGWALAQIDGRSGP